MALFKRKPKIKTYDYIDTKEYFEKTKSLDPNNFLRCPDWALPEFDEYGNYTEEPSEFLPLFDIELQKRFYTEGRIAIGAIVQANTLLFQRGKIDSPANFIYTMDPFFIKNPHELIGLAGQLFSIKGREGFIPSIQKLADLLADEYSITYSYRLPRNVMDDRDVFFTTVVVNRDHLPYGVLTPQVTYPMIVLPDNKPDAMILPHWFWK